MAELSVDTTYAQALFGVAEEKGTIEETREEVLGILEVFKEEPEFYKLFVTPSIAAEEKREVLKKVFTGRISPEMLHFLYILVDKGRCREYEKIARVYDRLADLAAGLVDGEVYSVKELSPAQMEKLTGQTEKLIGRKVKLVNKLDRSLLGGLKVVVGGKIFDASFKRRLNDLRNAMD